MILRFTVGLLLVLLISKTTAQIPTDVVQLDEESFEHDTQAATGQTTGFWFVLFNARQHPRSAEAHTLWAQLAADEEKDVIYAEVQLGEERNKALARRFKTVQPPQAVLFRDRQMYTYRAPLRKESADAVRAWVNGGFQKQAPEDVPGVRTLKKDVAAEASTTNWFTIKWSLGLLAGGFLLKNWARNTAKENERKAKRAAAKAAAAAGGAAGAGEDGQAAGGKSKAL